MEEVPIVDDGVVLLLPAGRATLCLSPPSPNCTLFFDFIGASLTSLLQRIMRAIPEAGRRAKVLVRALCAVVDNFHFTLTSSTSKPGSSSRLFSFLCSLAYW